MLLINNEFYSMAFLDASGSPSLRSPTENSIASLVSAAAIVKAKSESEGEGQSSAGKYQLLPAFVCKL